MDKVQTKRDIFLILFLSVLSYVATYHLPSALKPLVYIGIVFSFIRSKDNAPWIVFFFFLFSAPASLFYGHDRFFLMISAKIGIQFSFIVSIAFLIKGIKMKDKIRNRFAFERNLYLFLIVLLFFIGFVQGGMSMRSWFIVLKQVPHVFFILFLPVLVDLKKDSMRIKHTLYILTIILFLIQLYEVIFGQNLIPESSFIISTEDEQLQRNITGLYFVFFTFLIAISDVLSKKSNSTPLEIIAVFVSILILVNTALRGFMIAITFIVIGLLMLGNKPKAAIITSVSILIVSLVLYFGPVKYVNNLTSSFDRLSTVLLVLEGDKSAGGSLSRVTKRAPRVMNEFKKSPVLGTGFNDQMIEYYDGHVANQSILLLSGIFGFTVIYFIILKILFRMINLYLRLRTDNIVRFRLLSMVVGFLGIMIVHFTSEQMYSYIDREDHVMLLAFWFLFTFYYLDEAVTYGRYKGISNRY